MGLVGTLPFSDLSNKEKLPREGLLGEDVALDIWTGALSGDINTEGTAHEVP